jgi:acyl-CoA hydrolase
VVLLGGNDFLRRVPIEETVRNLDAIAASLVAAGSMVVLLEINVGLLRDPYLEGYRAVADRHGALLVEDVLQGILTDPALRVDPIHPNARGHALIADRLVAALQPLLREAERRRSLRSNALSCCPLG